MCHKPVLHQKMVNEKLMLVVFGFAINPELIGWDVWIPVMLAKVSKFFIDVSAYVIAIHKPNLDVSAFI